MLRDGRHVIPRERHASLAESWKGFLATGHARGQWEIVLADGRTRHIEFHRKANFLAGRHISILREVER